jgi:hypothetical protein
MALSLCGISKLVYNTDGRDHDSSKTGTLDRHEPSPFEMIQQAFRENDGIDKPDEKRSSEVYEGPFRDENDFEFWKFKAVDLRQPSNFRKE